jgi:transcriptional regulator with XRE-family HTH domain
MVEGIVDVPLVIRHRLKDLGLEQRQLAAAAHVTESYVSQLLARRKAPPAPRRTDIYDKMEAFLQLPHGELARLAELQRKEESKRKVADPTPPLCPGLRAFLLRKCRAVSRVRVQAILEKEPFGDLERLIAQKLMEVAKAEATVHVDNEKWIRRVARFNKESLEQTRGRLSRLMSADTFGSSIETFVPFLDRLVDSWNIELETFAVEIIVNRELSAGGLKRFELVERESGPSARLEPGLKEFFRDKTLSGDATEEEMDFLKRLDLKGRRPAPIYYYRELQNLPDPVHFRNS